MRQAPFELVGDLRIGTVSFVSPDEIKVILDSEAPESIALNAGAPQPFPRVNGYLLIPVNDILVVGQIEWITIEHSPFPKRQKIQDSSLINLPYPLLKLCLNPLGTLRVKAGDERYVFQRGANALPSVGASVMLPTVDQLRSIIESGARRRVKIGSSPLADDASVYIDPDRLFGRHLAVLGNTGSGKSCSVAGLIRWSLEQSQQECGKIPNARFIILDPNGEYSRAFDGKDTMNARVFKVEPDKQGDRQLNVPLWFWNSAELSSFTKASPKTQQPTLVHALQFARDGQTVQMKDTGHTMRQFLRIIVTIIGVERNKGNPWGSFPKSKNFYEKIEKWKRSMENELNNFDGARRDKLQDFISLIEKLCKERQRDHAHYDFTLQDVNDLLSKASEAHTAFGGSESDIILPNIDAPISYDSSLLPGYVEAVAQMLNVSEYMETLLIRIRALLSDTRMKPILDIVSDITLERWLHDYVGSQDSENGCISIIDFSLVPSDVVHIITAVIARMIFDSLQRYVKFNGQSLPTVLVMEEAHTFIKRYRSDIESQDAETVCCQAFERIAREGRKFGLGLVLSSQRPSELSSSVLSQCNTFLLHRISNDRDQEIVKNLVPDNLSGLLRELPSLPSQNAILLGWASELPVLLKMNHLPETQRPRSDDPDYWGVWTWKKSRSDNWKSVADDWRGQAGDGNINDGIKQTENPPDPIYTPDGGDQQDDLPF